MNAVIWISALLLIVFSVFCYLVRYYYSRKLRKAVWRAQKSEQLKSAFVDNVSRSLRSPLNAILGYSNMIVEESDATMQPAHVKELARNISNDTQQLIDFVSQLIEMSKFEGITPSFTFIEVNLTELMASYRREAMTMTKPDVTVRVSSDLSPHCRAVLDTNFMHQLMMHLLANAARHVTQGDIVIKYGHERKGLKVAVTYTGIGQAELLGADIYSFLQKEDALKNVHGSSVLGLSICKAIVEMLGGEFYMDTEYDKKTVASFWFPCKMKDTHRSV
jgi:K+-sensing histidine kinase KdpD